MNEILAGLYAEGREANRQTAEEIITRLEAEKNFVPSSDRTRREYAHILLKEYKSYIDERS